MLETKGICQLASENLEALREQRHAQQDEIGELEGQLRLQQGKIRESENRLSRIVNAISSISISAVGCGLSVGMRDLAGSARDCTAVAINLANHQAEEEQRVRELHRGLQEIQWNLEAAKRQLAITEANIARAHHDLDANDCR